MDAEQVPEIDTDELVQRMEAGAVVFDVREPDEHTELRIPGVVLVPLGTVADSIERFRRAARDAAACVVCAAGGRSAQAVAFLRANGIDAVNVAGGTNAWFNAGKPVETGPVST